jgi:hypothetical protein
MKNQSTQFQFKSLIPMMMLLLIATACNQGSGWDLVWSEEFDYAGAPAEESWTYEIGHTVGVGAARMGWTPICCP